MSTQTSLASLLQQDITIITVKEIRYQGKLYSYDTTKFTITLQDVRCFGTEQRVTSSPVPSRKDIFRYVVFNANQIKSFVPINNNAGLSDPAIIATMDDNAGSSRNRRGSPKKSSAGPHPQTNLLKMLGNNYSQLRTVDMNRLMGGHANESLRSGQHPQGDRKHSNKKNKRGNQARQEDELGQRTNRRTQNKNSNKQNSRHVSFKGDGSKQADERRQFTHIPQIPRKALNRENRRGTGQESKTAPTPGRFLPRKTPVKFDEEFDFDKALEEFKELSTNDKAKKDKPAETAGDDSAKGPSDSSAPAANTESAEPVYNQDKSFFDKLTTTTEHEGQQRPSRKEVMQTNKETFGVPYLPGRRFRNRNGLPQRHSGGNQNNQNRNGHRRQQQQQQNNNNAFERTFRRMLAAY